MTWPSTPLSVALADPKGLVRESYRIEGISEGECRSIFIDWALSLAPGTAPAPAIACLLKHYGSTASTHPMTAILREGLADTPAPRRRGGRAGRRPTR